MTLEELLVHVKTHEKMIFVRGQQNGQWGPQRLADLDPQQWTENVIRWFTEGWLPIVCKVDPPNRSEGRNELRF